VKVKTPEGASGVRSVDSLKRSNAARIHYSPGPQST